MKDKEICSICNRITTNPVCVRCSTKHFIVWLNDYDIDIEKRLTLTRKIRNYFFFESLMSYECLLCKSETMYVCSYCFFYEIVIIMKKLNFPEDMLKDFCIKFNHAINTDDNIIPDRNYYFNGELNSQDIQDAY